MRSHTMAYRSHSFSVSGLPHNISTASRGVRAPRKRPSLMMRRAVASTAFLLRKKENIGAHPWDAYRIHFNPSRTEEGPGRRGSRRGLAFPGDQGDRWGNAAHIISKGAQTAMALRPFSPS